MRQFLLKLLPSEEKRIPSPFETAAWLMERGHFAGAIEAYRALAERFPQRRAECELHMGAARHFIGDYREALRHYEAARALGAEVQPQLARTEEALRRVG